MRFQLDPFSPTGVSVDRPSKVIQGSNGYVVHDVTNLIKAGSNVTLTGQGTTASPYTIAASVTGGSGSGDMLASTYDPNGVAADAFDYDNFTNTRTIPTATSDLTND